MKKKKSLFWIYLLIGTLVADWEGILWFFLNKNNKYTNQLYDLSILALVWIKFLFKLNIISKPPAASVTNLTCVCLSSWWCWPLERPTCLGEQTLHYTPTPTGQIRSAQNSIGVFKITTILTMYLIGWIIWNNWSWLEMRQNQLINWM